MTSAHRLDYGTTMTKKYKESGPDTDEYIPWYLKIPIEVGDNGKEEEWLASPYFGEISIGTHTNAENDATSQRISEARLGIKSLKRQLKFLPKNTDVKAYLNRRDQNVFAITEIPPTKSQSNTCVCPLKRDASEKAIGECEETEYNIIGISTNPCGGEFKEPTITDHNRFLDRTPQKKEQYSQPAFENHQPHHRQGLLIDASDHIHRTTDPFKESHELHRMNGDVQVKMSNHARTIESITNHHQFLEKAPQKQKQLLTGFPRSNVHGRPITVNQSYHKLRLSLDAPDHMYRMTDYLFEESSEFQPYNGTIEDLLQYPLQSEDISQKSYETFISIIQYIGPMFFCMHVMLKLWKKHRGMLTMQASKRNIVNPDDIKTKSKQGKCQNEGKIELVAIQYETEKSYDGKHSDNEDIHKEDVVPRCSPQLSSENSNALLVLKNCESENCTRDIFLDQHLSLSSDVISERQESREIAMERISPGVSKEVLANNKRPSDNTIPELSLEKSTSSLSLGMSTEKLESRTTASLSVRDKTSSDIINGSVSSTHISMSGKEVADYIKILTSSFSQEGLDNQSAFQLAQMALDIKYKEMSEIRRIQIEERRRNEDMSIKERRHQQNIKVTSQDLHILRDEVQAACTNLRNDSIDICIGSHQIMCILVACGMCAFKQNRTILKEMISTAKMASVLDLVSLWACNCTENTAVTPQKYFLLILQSLVPPSLSSAGICTALCILRTLMGGLLFASVHKVLSICKSPQFLHNLLNCTVFAFVMFHTDVAKNMIRSATIVIVINFMIAVIDYAMVLVTIMKGCNRSIDELDCKNMINRALRASLYSRFISAILSLAVGCIVS